MKGRKTYLVEQIVKKEQDSITSEIRSSGKTDNTSSVSFSPTQVMEVHDNLDVFGSHGEVWKESISFPEC